MKAKLIDLLLLIVVFTGTIMMPLGAAQAENRTGFSYFYATITGVHAWAEPQREALSYQDNLRLHFSVNAVVNPEHPELTYRGNSNSMTLPVCEVSQFSLMNRDAQMQTIDGLLAAVSDTNHRRFVTVVMSIAPATDGTDIVLPVCIANQSDS